MDNLKTNDSLNKNAYIMLFTAVITKIIGALFKIPLAADTCLGDLGFGYFSSAYDFLTPISVLALSGFPIAVSRIIAENLAKGDEKTAVTYFSASKKLLYILAFLGFICLLLFIFPFVKLTDKTGQSLYSMLAIAPCFILCCILSIYRGFFEGHSNMKPIAVSNLLETAGKLVIGYSLALLTVKLTGNSALGAAAALFGITFSTAVCTLYIYVKYRRNAKFNEFNKSEKNALNSRTFKKLMAIMLPIAISSLASSIISLFDSLTVRSIISKGISENASGYFDIFSKLLEQNNVEITALPTVLYGIRGKAFTLFNLVPALIIALSVGVVPSITEANSLSNKAKLNKGLHFAFKLTAVIAFPVGLGFIFFNANILNLLYGTDETSVIGGKMLVIFGFSLIFAAFTIIQSAALLSVGKQKAVFVNVVAGLLIKLILNILLTLNIQFNIYGCVIATLICYFIIFVANTIILNRYFKFFEFIISSYKSFLAAVVASIFGFLALKMLEFKAKVVVAILITAILYFVFLLILRTFSAEELEEIPLLNKFFGKKTGKNV